MHANELLLAMTKIDAHKDLRSRLSFPDDDPRLSAMNTGLGASTNFRKNRIWLSTFRALFQKIMTVNGVPSST